MPDREEPIDFFLSVNELRDLRETDRFIYNHTFSQALTIELGPYEKNLFFF